MWTSSGLINFWSHSTKPLLTLSWIYVITWPIGWDIFPHLQIQHWLSSNIVDGFALDNLRWLYQQQSWNYKFDFFATSCIISHATSSPFTRSKTHVWSSRHKRAFIVSLQNIFAIFIVATMKQTDLILKNPATTDEKFNNLILQGSFRLCKWLSLRRLVLWINHLPPACWSTFCKSIFKHQFGCRFDILDSISSFFLYFDICDHICLDTSYHFLALPLFLKYSLFFQVLMYKHLP